VGREGPNAQLTDGEVERALGSDKVKQIANEAGVPESEAKSGLAKMLPDMIDKLTPEGMLPEGIEKQVGGLASRSTR
jgi:uncharacterized protein YidB (DUF937 family)